MCTFIHQHYRPISIVYLRCDSLVTYNLGKYSSIGPSTQNVYTKKQVQFYLVSGKLYYLLSQIK